MITEQDAQPELTAEECKDEMHPLEEQSSSCCGNLSTQTAPRAAFLLRIALAALSAGAEAILRAAARPRSRSDLRRPRRALGPPQGRHSAAQRDPPGSQRLTFSRQAAPGAGTAVRWMTISCPPLCTSLSSLHGWQHCTN